MTARPARTTGGDHSLHRVALGPSVTRWRDPLQRRLGPGWIVHDLISGDLLGGPDDIVILGTEEIAPGGIQVGRRGRVRSVLIGTEPPRPTRPTGTGTVRSLLDPLADMLRSLATPAQSAAT